MCDINHFYSELISEVLDDLALDDESVYTKRWQCLYVEAFKYLASKIPLTNKLSSAHIFGSQSEGTSTPDLGSDIDLLLVIQDWSVIQDMKFWQKGVKHQLLKLQDGEVTPGYCLLQPIQSDCPLPEESLGHGAINDKMFIKDEAGRILLKNTAFPGQVPNEFFRNGPAISKAKTFGVKEMDLVSALFCPQWPEGARIPCNEKYSDKWPTQQMKAKAEATGCFVVPVSGKKNENDNKEENDSKKPKKAKYAPECKTNETEWRISTSKAERILMFSLNETQRKCYVLMKMTLKSFVHPVCGKIITSYMCKNILFRMITKTDREFWTKHNLLVCFIQCLEELHRCVGREVCEHFIMPDCNIMNKKFTPDERVKLLEILSNILKADTQIPIQIFTDFLAARLLLKVKERHPEIPGRSFSAEELKSIRIYTKEEILRIKNVELKSGIGQHLGELIAFVYDDINSMIQDSPNVLHQMIDHLHDIAAENGEECLKAACYHVEALLKSIIGCVKSSNELYQDNRISEENLQLFPEVTDSDNLMVSLKKASVCYCMGKLSDAEKILSEIQELSDTNIIRTMCICKLAQKHPGFIMEAFLKINKPLVTSLCVTFLHCELHCIPKELQYELYKFPWQLAKRRFVYKFWIDWATVDIMPYVFFLQYKVYQRLNQECKKESALNNLQKTVMEFYNFSNHTEVALNLLGQCLEEDRRFNEALFCYIKSLNVTKNHNAASIHICRLLGYMINRETSV